VESPERTVYLKLFGAIDEALVKAVMATVEQKLSQGVTRFVLLMSSPGGNVFAGITLYNFLKGIPAEVVTHNIGSTNSIAAAVFCAGDRRLSVPHGVFLIHGARANFPQGAALEHDQLQERVRSLRIDTENIAGIIAANTKRTEPQVMQDMLDRITLSPEEALDYGLVHEIREEIFPAGAELISIQPS
jgi:ATP-dependent protease ClpP protease subunit